MIENHKARIRTNEENLRKVHGQQITLSIPSGAPVAPAGYTFNEAKQICVNSAGKTAQPTRSTTDYDIWVMVFPITGEELKEYSVGDLKIGGALIEADIDYFDNFSDAVKEKVLVALSGDNFKVSTVIRDSMNTKIQIGCVREE